jgi:hypothetical protein
VTSDALCHTTALTQELQTPAFADPTRLTLR